MAAFLLFRGHAYGFGCTLILNCDHSIMIKSTSYVGFPEVRMGCALPKCICRMFVNTCGHRKAEHDLKMGKLFTPEEALQLGIVDELVESSADLLSRATEVMNEWLKIPGTAHVVLQKPPVNSLSVDMLQKLTSTIKDLEEKKVRGIIISSSSPKVFCAGLDITQLHKPPEERLRSFWKAFQTFWKTLYSTPLITIAAVNGHAPAGGCVLLLSCDHSVMLNSDCRLGLNESLLGFAAPKWVRSLLVNACGTREAVHALNTSKLFTPKEALKLNIVDELVDSSSDLLPKAEEALNQFLKVPGPSFQKQKLNFRKPFVDDLISYENQDVDDMVKNILQDETQEILGKYMDNLKNKKK